LHRRYARHAREETTMQNPTTPGALTREGFIEQAFHTGTLPADNTGKSPSANPSDVVAFWSEAGPSRWFAKDEAFDRRFRDTFMDAHTAACRGELDQWQHTPGGALALVILLDQFPRNSFRGTPRMYASDMAALRLAEAAIAAGHDRHIDADLRLFLYLPFAHSESLAHQERCVALCRELGGENLAHAEGHRDIVKRFGRFPHRNVILGRQMTAEEQRFLDAGGYAG
jgi:uncharacterized protein (DUF924 family)